MKKIHALLSIALAGILCTSATPLFAQAYRSQIQVLEDVAVRQYERGDYATATKQFGWILRIEPNNAVAQEYLQKIAKAPASSATPAPERAQEIISDINTAKTNLIQNEKDSRELITIIRDLITENDAIYQALYKRSREVVELREKFYGTPYGDAYNAVMKDLPIDRVPQRLHRIDDILPEESMAAREVAQNDINALIEDIAAIKKQPAATATVREPEVNPELNAALQAKREALVEKTVAITEKNNSLTELKDQLTSMNTGLKQTSNRYVEALQKIDNYYSRIKNELAKKNYVEQRMFSELVADYADKLKEIEALKSTTRTKDATLVAFKPALESANDQLRKVDSSIAASDNELSRLKELLVQYKNDLNLADNKVNSISSQVTDIEKTLKDGDDQLALLKKNIAQVKKQGPGQTEQAETPFTSNLLESNQKANEQLKALQEQLTTINEELKKPLSPIQDDEKKALRQRVAAIEEQLKLKNKEVAETNSSINNLTIREQALLARLADHEQTTLELNSLKKEDAQLRKSLLDTKTQMDTHSKALADANARIKTLNAEAKPKDSRIAELSQQVAELQHYQRSLHPVNDACRAQDRNGIEQLEARLRETMTKLTEAEKRMTKAELEAASLKEKLTGMSTPVETVQPLAPVVKSDPENKALASALVSKDEELSAVKAQLSKLQDQRSEIDALTLENQNLNAKLKEALTKAAFVAPASEPAPAPQSDLCSISLDLKERDAQILKLHEELKLTTQALQDAQDQATSSVQKASLLQIKQQAIDKIMDDRDTKIARMDIQIQALKDELAAAGMAQQEDVAKVEDASSAQAIAEKQIISRDNEIVALRVKVQEVQADLEAMKQLLAKKDRDHDATLKELRRVSELINK